LSGVDYSALRKGRGKRGGGTEDIGRFSRDIRFSEGGGRGKKKAVRGDWLCDGIFSDEEGKGRRKKTGGTVYPRRTL